MEEFIDGEFSGSNYVITDGSLVDADCQQFLTVSTTPTSYSVFPYSVYREDGVIQGTSQFGVFINNLTAPPNGGILLFKEDDDTVKPPPVGTIKRVKITYLKISRFDKEGNDNTLSLQELTEIRWTDSSAGLIDLKILNISEYPTYYLYAVLSKTFVNPTFLPGDDNILNYSLSASFTGTSASAGLYYLDQWNIINSSGGTFNTNYYTFDVTPNITTRYTASITAKNNNTEAAVTFDFGFWENVYNGDEISYNPIALTQSVSIPAGATRTFTLRGVADSLFIGNPNVQYHLETNNLTAPISLSNTFWIVTHSIAPQTSTSSVVLEPYLLSTFRNSDCDVLMNNYSENDYSNFYREVLYDNGGIIPSNLQQIISGTAQYAELNDYLYNANANVLPRYKGVRVTQQQLNKWTPGDVGFSQTPSVTSEQTYFAYFDYLQDTSYELIGKSAAHIIYLVDKDGNIQIPTLTGSYYYNLIDNFETDKNINLTVTTLNGDKIFLGNKKIIRPGVFPRALLYSQLKDDPTVISSLTFGNQQFGYVPTYNSIYRPSTQFVIGDNGAQYIFGLGIAYDPSNEIFLDPLNNRIKILSDSNVTKLTFSIYTNTQVVLTSGNVQSRTVTATLYLQKSLDGINWNTVDQVSGYYLGNRGSNNGNTTNSYTFNFEDNPIENAWYRIMMYSGNGYETVYFKTDSYFEIAQTVAGTDTSTITYNPGNNLYYWTTGSLSPNILTSSQFPSVYSPGFPLTQGPTINSGYADCIPFLISPNITQMRFEGDENQVYTVTNVEYNINSSSFDDLNNYVPNGGSNWIIGGGSASASPSPGTVTANNYIQRSINGTLVPGKAYTVLFSIKESVSGSLYFDFNNGYTSNISSSYNILNTPLGSGFGSAINVIAPSNIPGGNYLRIRGNDSASITLDYVSIFFDNNLYLTLNKSVVPGTDINSFLIREFQPNANYVILDSFPIGNSSLSETYDGYMMPEYITNDLRQNFDNIIISLRERTLI